jgi:hypothetical protein
MPLLDKKGGIMPKLTPEQILDIINKAQDALAQGDHIDVTATGKK